MNCQQARQQWMLYFDSEGDAELHLRLNDHLAMCPGCAEWFSKQSRLESLLSDKLREAAPTPELWHKVLTRSGLLKPARSHLRFWLAGMAACAIGILIFWLAQTPPDLAKLAASWHERVAAGQEPEFRPKSDNPDLEVDGYLRKQVSFKMRCPPRKDVGFEVRGAGVCALADKQAAYLTGHVGKQPVSIFVLADDDLPQFVHQWQTVQREGTHRCREGDYQMVLRIIKRNAVIVIGTLDADRLESVLNAYGTYPEPEG